MTNKILDKESAVATSSVISDFDKTSVTSDKSDKFNKQINNGFVNESVEGQLKEGERPKRNFDRNNNGGRSFSERNNKSPRRNEGGFRGNNYNRERDDFKTETLEVKRVMKTTTGGKKLSFTALVIVGNGEGTIGVGKGKDKEVSGAINKALNHAYANLVRIPRHKTSIVHDVRGKTGSTSVLIKRAKKGTGRICCNPIKVLMTLGGVEDLVSKVVTGGSTVRNIINATLDAIGNLETPRSIATRRGKSVESLIGASGKKQQVKLKESSLEGEKERAI